MSMSSSGRDSGSGTRKVIEPTTGFSSTTLSSHWKFSRAARSVSVSLPVWTTVGASFLKSGRRISPIHAAYSKMSSSLSSSPIIIARTLLNFSNADEELWKQAGDSVTVNFLSLTLKVVISSVPTTDVIGKFCNAMTTSTGHRGLLRSRFYARTAVRRRNMRDGAAAHVEGRATLRGSGQRCCEVDEGKKKKKNLMSSPARNRTRSCCVRDSDVSHYTTEDFCILLDCAIATTYQLRTFDNGNRGLT